MGHGRHVLQGTCPHWRRFPGANAWLRLIRTLARLTWAKRERALLVHGGRGVGCEAPSCTRVAGDRV